MQQRMLDSIPAPGLGAEASLALKEAITRLPEETRVVFQASVVEGHSVQQVCRSARTHSRAFYARRRQAEEALRNAAVRR